jgi:hypothetical protein
MIRFNDMDTLPDCNCEVIIITGDERIYRSMYLDGKYVDRTLDTGERIYPGFYELNPDNYDFSYTSKAKRYDNVVHWILASTFFDFFSKY